MKHLTIRNFGPIKDVDIDLARVNIIIGPQSSGKSTVLKVACYCGWVERQVEMTQKPERYFDKGAFLRNLTEFHKLQGYLHPDTYIEYKSTYISFTYSNTNGKSCEYKWNERSRWNYHRPKMSYIPAERNLVAAIPNWYQVSMKNDNILDYMKEWEFVRKAFPKGEKILDLKVEYAYNPKSTSLDIIRTDNGAELDLTVASSGLQSLVPLYVMLRYLTKEYYNDKHSNVEQEILKNNLLEALKNSGQINQENWDRIADRLLIPDHTELFIEEPEAHIFPSTQKSFVYALAGMLNARPRKHSCFIATHSPYILTSLNNLIQAGEILDEAKEIEDGEEKKNRIAQVTEIIPQRNALRYKDIAAFEMQNGCVKSIMDAEYKLISADAIDSASDEISKDFNCLLNL